ncbi:MAG: GH39 family glycosyl hydrolase, partial [Suipraeoptans sp.]
LAQHLKKRYGAVEVEKWFFELWHDPRTKIHNEDSWYYNNFENGYRILKELSPNINVGGAGFALGYEKTIIKQALKHWSNRNIRPDFISVYSFNYIMNDWEDGDSIKKSLDTHFISNQIDMFKQYMNEADFDVPNIFVTEWNFTMSNRNRLNDSCASAAFIMRDCIETMDKVNVLAHWHGTDIYSESHDASGILSGDSGLITRDNIKKPAFYALSFLNELERDVLGRNEHSIVTAGRDNTYRIACHNSKKMSYRYALREEDEVTYEEQNSLFENDDSLQLQYAIQNVENGTYLIKMNYINEGNGNIQRIWSEMGFSTALLPDEIEYLRNSAMPHLEMKQVKVRDNILRIECSLLAHEIRLIDIRKQGD